MEIIKKISNDFNLPTTNVNNVITLLNDNATIPFIARYRKELTAGMDEIVLREIRDRYEYLVELGERKKTILKSVEEQGKLTSVLKKEIESCPEKSKLEDLYLPYKPKRKTRASVARERGLEPLLVRILSRKYSNCDIREEAQKYVNEEKGVETVEIALKGASDIYAEMIAERAEHREYLRNLFLQKGKFVSKVRKDFENKKTKFEMYYNYQCPVKTIPAHNLLALRRAEREKVILFDIEVDQEEVLKRLYEIEKTPTDGPVSFFLEAAIKDAYVRLLRVSLCAEIRLTKKLEAELESIKTFEKNLQNLLLASPAGHNPVLAIDPGFRSGCKVAALDKYGIFQEYKSIFPHPPQQKKVDAQETVFRFIKKYSPEYIVIGNGTASRETERFIKNVLKEYKDGDKPHVLLISEAGASVYSASESAINEFPDLDLTIRGAISIGRRLIDPLAELVKIDPKSIGVGQYQHDVDQKLLKKRLDQVVEHCVNFVGVDLNVASVELLSNVSGINKVISGNIIDWSKENGPFRNRKQLLDVPRLGEKVFEQASGFLRIKDGDTPLDNSAVHPESYYVVKKIAKDMDVDIKELIGNSTLLNKIEVERYVDDKKGSVSIKDIIEELKKPGRDPRANFTYANFQEDVNSIKDLKEGMRLEGVVTNVANFGAFIDIGVHQDGLVHISQMANQYVKDPTEIVKVGQTINVKVLQIDEELKRISLTMK